MILCAFAFREGRMTGNWSKHG